MLDLILASLMSAAVSPAAPAAANPAAPAKSETRYCREMGNASSRMYAIKICKTRAGWKRYDACNSSVTRYCTPRNKGRATAFAMNDDSRIICRTVSVTGTRLKQQQACLPKREWDRMFQEANASVFKRIMEHSTMVPNQ
ncbi:hypothetical protein [Sphingomonas mesophila]|uniref:hypothetical protein n=1 Tax=Sphingomonas mesophila TaxID=2303576 RepID=UPI000E587635|nr:hypothetical protein [Sphingomonas mesophila]